MSFLIVKLIIVPVFQKVRTILHRNREDVM